MITQHQLNSIKTYISVIQTLLDHTNFDIVFKAHPWEEKKNNIRSPLTYSEILQFKANLKQEDQSRLYVTNHSNLNRLISNASGFITICSQSALEAAYNGLKPVIIGSAFFDGYGFTSNYPSAIDFETAQKNKSISYAMSFIEYLAYEKFIIVTLCMHLVSVHKSGSIRLNDIFKKTSFIKVLSSNTEKSIIENNVNTIEKLSLDDNNTDIVDKIVNVVKMELKDNKDLLDGNMNSLNTKFEKIILELEESKKSIKPSVADIAINKNLIKNSNVELRVLKLEGAIVKNLGTNRLYQKYSKHRKVFFEDIKNPIASFYWRKFGRKIDSK